MRRGATFEPMAELRKLMASLATPTTMPITARMARMMTMAVNKGDIVEYLFRFWFFPFLGKPSPELSTRGCRNRFRGAAFGAVRGDIPGVRAYRGKGPKQILQNGYRGSFDAVKRCVSGSFF